MSRTLIRGRLRILVSQFMKFGVVGISNTLISLGCYYLLVSLGWHYLMANTVGFVVSVCNSYFWNSRFVFKNKTESNEMRAFAKVVVSYGLSFCTSSVLMVVFVQLLGVSEWLAPILRLVFTVPINFCMNKLWAFGEHID